MDKVMPLPKNNLTSMVGATNVKSANKNSSSGNRKNKKSEKKLAFDDPDTLQHSKMCKKM